MFGSGGYAKLSALFNAFSNPLDVLFTPFEVASGVLAVVSENSDSDGRIGFCIFAELVDNGREAGRENCRYCLRVDCETGGLLDGNSCCARGFSAEAVA